MTGRSLGEEARRKISAALKGRIFSEESLRRMSAAHKGQPSARKGAHHTEDAKQKLREARKKQWHPSFVKRGITREMVEDAVAKGRRWCSGKCKAFVPIEDFSGESQKCRKCVAATVQRIRDKWSPEQRQANADYLREWRGRKKEHLFREWLSWIVRFLAYLDRYKT
ncbi:MAG: NUMOD3 domain-containing DNA-binding protein [Terriglobia bacterium]